MSDLFDALSPFAGSPIASPGGLIPDGMYPSGYGMKLLRETRVIAHGSTMEYFEAILEDHPTVYAWAAKHPDRRDLSGRRAVYAVPLPGNEDVTVVVRHNEHGGLLRGLTRDVFRTPRAARELRISWTLRHVGIATPRVIGYAQYPLAGGQLWRADVVTREVPVSKDLAAMLSVTDTTVDHRPTLDAAITLLRRLARTWAFHPDLNVKNILISTELDGSITANVLDVDTLRFAEKNAEWMNVARLLRSAQKWRRRTGHAGFSALIERLGG